MERRLIFDTYGCVRAIRSNCQQANLRYAYSRGGSNLVTMVIEIWKRQG